MGEFARESILREDQRDARRVQERDPAQIQDDRVEAAVTQLAQLLLQDIRRRQVDLTDRLYAHSCSLGMDVDAKRGDVRGVAAVGQETALLFTTVGVAEGGVLRSISESSDRRDHPSQAASRSPGTREARPVCRKRNA